MKWGGDNNTDTVGYEGIYIDIDRLKNVSGGLTDNIIELDLRGIWYAEVGQNPVVINATGYEGGTMTLEERYIKRVWIWIYKHVDMQNLSQILNHLYQW